MEATLHLISHTLARYPLTLTKANKPSKVYRGDFWSCFMFADTTKILKVEILTGSRIFPQILQLLKSHVHEDIAVQKRFLDENHVVVQYSGTDLTTAKISIVEFKPKDQFDYSWILKVNGQDTE